MYKDVYLCVYIYMYTYVYIYMYLSLSEFQTAGPPPPEARTPSTPESCWSAAWSSDMGTPTKTLGLLLAG